MKLRILSIIAILAALIFVFAVSAYAEEAVPENYVDTNDGYIIYTDDQYKEVILGVYEGTLANKKIILGCDISVTLDLYMEKPCDITIDLNGHTYTNNYRPVKAGDFDLRHKDAIIRISNGNMVSNFCVFIFQKNSDEAYKDVDNMGQVYLENVNISCQEEIVYNYGGHGGVLSFKNCNLDVRGENYSVMGLGNCQTGEGTLYQIDGGSYDGLQIHCAKPGSYIKNCTVYNRNLNIDSWHGHSESGGDVSVEVRNVVIEIEIYLNDALVDPILYDCTFPKVNLSNKSNAMIVSYTSPNCTEAGTMTTYHHLTEVTVDGEYPILNPALGHNLDIDNFNDIVYTSFNQKGKYVADCKNCDATNVEQTEASAPALFEGIKYSAPEGAKGELVISFDLNVDAISDYKSVAGDKFKFGVFATAKSVIGSREMFDEVGAAISGIMNVELTENNYTGFDLRIKGFRTDAHMSAKLAFGLYALELDDDVASVSYIQCGTPVGDDKYAFVSYNEVISLLS